MRELRRCRDLVAAFLLAGALGACSSSSGSGDNPLNPDDPTSRNTPKSALQTQPFASCDALRAYYSEALTQEILTQYRYGHCFGCEPGVFEPLTTEAAAPSDNFGAAPDAAEREVSQTNTQEAGVDEADIIETNPNGTEIFVLRQFPAELLVIDSADPANLRILSRTALDSERRPGGMFFDPANQRLAVILRQAYFYAYAGGGGGAPAMAVEDAAFAPPPYVDGTELQFYDVSDPANPQLVDRFVTDGHYVDARRIGSRIHLVSQFGFPYPQSLYANEDFQRQAWQEYPQAWQANDTAEIERLATAIRAHIEAAVAGMGDADLLPAESTQTGGEARLACTAIWHPEVPARLGLVLISSIDTDGTGLSTLGSINNSWQIYASSDSLYLLQSSGGWWFDPAQKQQTAISRFDLSSGSATAGAVGLVDGWVGDRFWLGQYQDHLRVVSSEGRFSGPDQAFVQHHHLSVLGLDDMNQTGQAASFVDVNEKPRETVRAVRFVGSRGYVVTFEQIDPLFTFDLSDPAAPRKVAELEIPGFSTYMHPLGDTHLLTIGRNAGDGGVGTGRGYQLQIFDVSNLAAPAVVAAHEPALADEDYAFSLAEYDPHAFTYLDAAGLLSIPVQISSPDSSRALSGFIAYRINAASGSESIIEYARVDHKDEAQDSGSGCPANRDDLPPEGCSGFAPVIYNEPLRSVIIFEAGALPPLDPDRATLLTLSSAKLKALDASGASGQELDTLPLSE